MSQETKRQHYVPRTYLQKFAIKRKKNYNIHAADKNNLENIIFPNITNICLETDIYTLTGQTKEQRQALETFYSDNVESVYNEVYQTLTDESIREIDEEIHYKIVMTIITMLYRTSKWIHLHNDFFDTVLDKMYSLCVHTGKDHFMYEDVKYSIKGKTLDEIKTEFKTMKKDDQVLTQLEIAFKLINIRKFDGILVSKITSENQLITSDNPVVLSNINPGIIAPFDPENMIRLPLDSKHILTIMPHSQTDGSHRISRTNESAGMSVAKMIANNSSQLKSSFKYILGTKKALSNFIENLKIIRNR
ncbi:MAG: DUF4238 domain-containing protein [Bacteroidota bacterium]